MFTTLHEASDAVVRVPNKAFVEKYARVRRQGRAPEPARDSKEPFFTITPGTRFSAKAPDPDDGAPAPGAGRADQA